MRLLIEAANATVAIEDGCIIEASGRFDHVVRVRDGEIRPGLINAHDHLHRNHYGRLGTPPYANAYEWAADIQSRFAMRIAEGKTLARRKALEWGAWRNLLSGVTHVVHHDHWEDGFNCDFPINVVRIANGDSLGMTPDFAYSNRMPFALHVAEGVDAAAAQEVRTLEARGLLNRNLLAVHLVGPDNDGIERLRASRCAMIWCPTSNHFLFGRTTPDALLAEGMDVLVGTDSLLTGEGTLLDELRVASHHLSASRLLDSVGRLAAQRLGIAEPSLSVGSVANLVVLRRPLHNAELSDVALVVAKGKLRVLDPALVAAAGMEGGRMLEWRGVRRWIDESNAGSLKTYTAPESRLSAR